MKPKASGFLLIISVILGTIIVSSTWSTGAQVAKTKATKEPAAKATPAPEPLRDDSATWLLAGREGECTPISLLEKKSPEFKGVKGPNQLAEKLRAMGHKTEIKEFKAGVRPAVEVRALSAGIDVMLVRQQHCDKKPPALPSK
jgi:hypothetical protein